MSDVCKHCGREIVRGESGYWLHVNDRGMAALARCIPEESGLEYGYNAGPADEDCLYPCLGAPVFQAEDEAFQSPYSRPYRVGR